MTIRMEFCPPQPIRFHEYAELFPWLEGEALTALREDIRQHGVREPIVMLDGAILDGRNRYMCARDLGIQYPVREFEGDDPLSFVISHNLHRRHLSESQRASVAARLANMERGNPSFKSANLQNSEAVLPGLSIQGVEPEKPRVSQTEAAKLLNVSPRAVSTAKKVQEEAPPEIVKAVDQGRISVSLAAKVAELPPEAQAEVIAAPPAETKEVAQAEVRKAFVANNSHNNEWYTPPEIIAAVRAVLGEIDLDPASSEVANRAVGATKIFTAEDDGLSQDWPVARIFMNPPYAAGLVGKFIDKFTVEIGKGSTGIVLVNNATETGWFQTLVAASSAVCFHRSRIRYVTPEGALPGAPLQGQAIIYAGPDPKAFAAKFSAFGMVLFTVAP